jgi:hypothetical protein
MVQVVQHLPSKHNTTSSDPSANKENNKKCQEPVAHACNPSYSGDKKSGGSWLEASLGE